MEVIDIQAVKDCLAEVSDCEDKQYAIALLEWAIGKRTFNLAEHDADLLDKVIQKQRTIIDEDGVMYKVVFLKDIEDMKAEVSK